MPPITSRKPFNPRRPYRTVRPATSKIIFLSCEGCVTEEEYFERVSTLFSEVKSRVQFISVAEEAVHTPAKHRTTEQNEQLSKVRPTQLVERINRFKATENDTYQFEQYPDDEFWVICDVDKNWSGEVINAQEGKTYRDEWNDAISACQKNGYKYAISNPFFEIWLLLHHDVVNDSDTAFAVTESHEYEKTDHFRNRLRCLGAPLKKQKHINPSDYTRENIKVAAKRACELHRDPVDFAPKYFATTVYLLIEEILKLIPEH